MAVGKAAGESQGSRIPWGTLSFACRTAADFFSILLEGKGQLKRLQGTLSRGLSCGRTFGISRIG